MGRTLAILFLLATPAAQAAEYAVILNDVEKKALLELIDAAVRANGLVAAPNAVVLASKINTAGTVTNQQPAPAPTDP